MKLYVDIHSPTDEVEYFPWPLIRNKAVKLVEFQVFQALGKLYFCIGWDWTPDIYKRLWGCKAAIWRSPKPGTQRASLFSNLRLVYADEYNFSWLSWLDDLSDTPCIAILYCITCNIVPKGAICLSQEECLEGSIRNSSSWLQTISYSCLLSYMLSYFRYTSLGVSWQDPFSLYWLWNIHLHYIMHILQSRYFFGSKLAPNISL